LIALQKDESIVAWSKIYLLEFEI